jgi:hypothetical protein
MTRLVVNGPHQMTRPPRHVDRRQGRLRKNAEGRQPDEDLVYERLVWTL